MHKENNMAAVEEFDLDEVEVKSGKVEKFKVEKDHKYRVGYPLLNKNGRVKIAKVDFFSYEDADEHFSSWRASSDKEVNEKAKKAGAVLKTRYVTLLVVYRTNKAGKPLNPLSYEILPVVMDGRKVSALKEINAEWDISTVDISITTENAGYQYHTYTPLKLAIWRLKKGDAQLAKLGLEGPIEEEVIAAAKAMEEDMIDAVAFERSDAKILETLGISEGEEEDSSAADADLDDEFDDLDEDDI